MAAVHLVSTGRMLDEWNISDFKHGDAAHRPMNAIAAHSEKSYKSKIEYRYITKRYKSSKFRKANKGNARIFPTSSKAWHPLFYSARPCHDQSSRDIQPANSDSRRIASEAVEPSVKRKTLTEALLSELENSIPSREAKVLRSFLSTEPTSQHDQCSEEAWAWVDDREHASSQKRLHANSSKPEELCQILCEKRYGSPCRPDVDRRLIYISKLTRDFVLALAETAWSHEMDALRDAICKHIAVETSLRVHIPSEGFASFRLEFHLGYLILRECPLDPNASLTRHFDGQAMSESKVADLTFLDISGDSTSPLSHTIHQAHISIVVCGWSNHQWTGYAFSNTGLPGRTFQEQNENGPLHDLFAADRDDDYVKDADVPTWDARRYWLQVTAIRCELVLKEWSYLVHIVQTAVQDWHRRNAIRSSSGQVDPNGNLSRSLDWTMEASQLLRTLQDSLFVTLKAYERFNAKDGDRRYFVDVADSSTIKNSLKETFEKLADLYSVLESLDETVQRTATHIGRILNLESNRFMNESNKLDQQSLHLNLRASELNDKLRDLNEKSADAACANLAAAAKTSRSTRVNVELLLFTTPFAMVLQYFGSEKEIFSFNRTPKTFVLATIVLMLVLRAVTLIFENADTLMKTVSVKVLRIKPRSERVDDESKYKIFHYISFIADIVSLYPACERAQMLSPPSPVR